MTRWVINWVRWGLTMVLGGFLVGCLPPGASSIPTSTERSLVSADGFRQVRSHSSGGSSGLELLRPSGDQPAAPLNLAGEITWLGWHPSQDLLIVTTELKGYSFGGNYKVRLYRWDGFSAPSSRLLSETTLKPLTLKRWGSRLTALPAPVLSPQGEALAFLRLHDPPAFDPYLKVVLISLAGEGEMVLESQAMPGNAVSFSPNGERVSWTASEGKAVAVYPWLGPLGADDPHVLAEETVNPRLLQLRPLLLQGLLSQADYHQQWLKRGQP